jgi:AraC-like DNA-binding protein
MAEAAALIGPPPDPISIRTVTFPAGTEFPSQRARWGKLLFPLTGIAEFVIAGEMLLSPPSYAIWIPPGIEHRSRLRHSACFTTIYIAKGRCKGMPLEPETLAIPPVLKAIARDFAIRRVTVPNTPQDHRLAEVVLDQCRSARLHYRYLPTTHDEHLLPILAHLRQHPGDRKSLSQWARAHNTTERTLSRRWRSAMGISFQEWRQRNKLVVAIARLDQGQPVHVVAYDLGFASPSAFIAMFRQMTGASPTRRSASTAY